MIPTPLAYRMSWVGVSGTGTLAVHALLVVVCLTVLIYWPGLAGGFLFDDFPNLGQIGARGPIETFELLRSYLTSGSAGPTGRPLSLLSFLLDASDWPTDPWPFKRTNLILHLATGLAIFATSRKLLEALGRPSRDAAWIGSLAAALWLVNPLFVSTTLYAVQRMTQLAALFVLTGIWCYLHGRALISSRPRLGYAWISIAIPLFTLLATLSKENGALLPLLVLVIHLLLRGTGNKAPSRLWTAVFVAAPSALTVGYLLLQVPDADRTFASRDFSLYERLLSQPRFLWDYLYHLAIPHIQTQGLFQDDRTVSTGLLHPWTTLPAVLGLAALVAGAWFARAKWPLATLAIFFFLAAHLIESTTVPLELYFEHRNYLPAAFLFLPAAAALYGAMHYHSRSALVIALTGTLIIGYALATWQRASLWGDRDQLMLVWAETNPGSARAQVSAAQAWLRQKQPDRALAVLDDANERMPDSVLVIVSRLAFAIELDQLAVAELKAAADRIRVARFDAQALSGLERLVTSLNAKARLPEHAEILGQLLQSIREDSAGRIPVAHRKAIYLQGLLLAGQGRPVEAMPHMLRAFELYDSIDTGFRIVSDLATLGHFEQALQMLDLSEEKLTIQGSEREPFSEKVYRRETQRLRAALLQDLRTAESLEVSL